MKYLMTTGFSGAAALCLFSGAALADESLFGYLRGAETLPKGATELVQHVTRRWDKGAGNYTAYDSKTELEYGVTDRFTSAVYLMGQSVNTQGLLIDGYIPKDERSGFKLSGLEVSAKYNFLSPAKDGFGLAAYVSGVYSMLDPHSGQKPRLMMFPLSAGRSWNLMLPIAEKAMSLTTACVQWVVPLLLRQSVQ